MRYTGSSTIEWPGMVSVYAVLGPQDGVTTTGAHQVGIDRWAFQRTDDAFLHVRFDSTHHVAIAEIYAH